ncbi:MAG: hypothetical protein ACREA0_21455, partial [bacterium]
DYPEQLRSRINMGFDTADMLDEEDPERDRAVPIPSDEDFASIEWWPREEAELLFDQLFPHGNSGKDYDRTARGLALVGMHSALEAYAKALGLPLKRMPLPRRIQTFLGARLDAGTYQVLVELDETRHIVIHNRGLVDDQYAGNVPYNKLVHGEPKPLGRQDLQRFADAVWRAALAMRDAAAGGKGGAA